MTGDMETPVTLGDKLATRQNGSPAEYALGFLISAIIGFLFWWASHNLVWGIAVMTFCALVFVITIFTNGKRTEHFLIHADQQGFMKALKLAGKTAIFDGSNIYHFGLDHGAGARPLKTLVQKLRADGYRIVCFFDANIYFTLRENGEFLRGEPFWIRILQTIFDLKATEIYVVPSGIQADGFIVETLSHLPKSFAVTNDRFRDYAAEYDFLAENNEWRKGVRIESGKLLLNQYSFKEPLPI